MSRNFDNSAGRNGYRQNYVTQTNHHHYYSPNNVNNYHSDIWHGPPGPPFHPPPPSYSGYGHGPSYPPPPFQNPYYSQQQLPPSRSFQNPHHVSAPQSKPRNGPPQHQRHPNVRSNSNSSAQDHNRYQKKQTSKTPCHGKNFQPGPAPRKHSASSSSNSTGFQKAGNLNKNPQSQNRVQHTPTATGTAGSFLSPQGNSVTRPIVQEHAIQQSKANHSLNHNVNSTAGLGNVPSGKPNTANSNNKQCTGPSQNESKFLTFALEDIPIKNEILYKVFDIEVKNFHNMVMNFKYNYISISKKMLNEVTWISIPDCQVMKFIARNIILCGHEFGIVGVQNGGNVVIEKLENLLRILDPRKVPDSMATVYLMHLVMLIETHNVHLTSNVREQKPFCELFISALTSPQKDLFRKLVDLANAQQKQELYSLRCRWEAYFTKSALELIDRNNFWKQGQQEVSTGNKSVQRSDRPIQCPGKPAQSSSNSVQCCKRLVEIPEEVIQIDSDDDDDEDVDKLGPLNKIIDAFLGSDWLSEFPIDKEDKRKFTEKYAVKKPSAKDSIYLYGTNVDYNEIHLQRSIDTLTVSGNNYKDEFINVAKEAFYIEGVFGKKRAIDVAEYLLYQMVTIPQPGQWDAELRKHLRSLLLIHIILRAEAKRSLYKNQPVHLRPFCNAFSSDTFLTNFRVLVLTLNKNKNRQKLYWMRLSWILCLPMEILSGIDDNNFWQNNGVRLIALPSTFTSTSRSTEDAIQSEEGDDEIAVVACVDRNEKRDEIAMIVLQSSDEEEDEVFEVEEDVVLTGVLIQGHEKKTADTSEPTVEKDNFIELFKRRRNDYWSKYFSIDDSDMTNLQKKYYFHAKQRRSNSDITDLDLAVEAFRETVLNMDFPVNEESFLNVVKEAFFLETGFGYGAPHSVAEFLVKIMDEGFEFCKSEETRLISQLFAFIMIHTIVSVENGNPTSLANKSKNSYVDAFVDGNTTISMKQLMASVDDNFVNERIKFLTLTWITIGENEACVSKQIKRRFKRNHLKETYFVREITVYLNELFERNGEAFYRDKAAARKNPRKRRFEVHDIEEESESELICTYVSCGETPKKKPKKKQQAVEFSAANTAKNIQNLFVPDVAKAVVSPSCKTKKRTSRLVDIKGKPLRFSQSTSDDDEVLRVVERNEADKIPRDKEKPSCSTSAVEEKVAKYFEADEFLDNLLTPKLKDFEIIFENGIAKVKFTHNK